MNCAVHTDVPATGYCRNCGKALCPQCPREVRGALYCEDCLAGLLTSPAAPEPGKAEVNPGLAATLGIRPKGRGRPLEAAPSGTKGKWYDHAP